jgi:hypothetical protein
MIDSLPSDINLVVKVVSGPKIWSVKCKSVGDGLSLFVGKYCKLSAKVFLVTKLGFCCVEEYDICAILQIS